ncbi:outer membrane receptor protein involved in Fe transport [Gillisia sp. Hel_I_86]|uniref:TonB-dependent receptor domain-containing protein n=1 Tax=Gillisia sp. Hel_I_86 TaxID=1249981 RepID=UPI001198DB3F|nr:TonB-dependent receptor [Gillisia sp. Hel_I_86]TVZ26149.1 outer membrane receptor protein involved in Fe transport [Gillisia sp. Hel_I_86]
MKTITTLLMAFICSISFGQDFTGKIIDKQNLPISFANIIAKDKADNSLITGVISDENGDFSIDLNNENFYLEISFVGFATKKIYPIEPTIGNIVLEEEGQQLQGVMITARKKLIQQKVDRLVFNVENTVAGTGGTALDALKATPSVNVDTDNLAIVGKGSVRVMVNDRIVQLSGNELSAYLSTIASDDIKSIEVITTPPSKYDAEGNSGLINIVLKKSKENSWNNQLRTSYTQATYPLFNFGNTFNYNKDKVNLIASLNGTKGNTARFDQYDIVYPSASTETNLDVKNKENMISGRLGLDYNVTDNATVGILYTGSFENKSINDDGRTLINDGNGTFTINQGNAERTNKNHSINAHYIQKLDTLGRKLSIDIDYFNFNNSFDRNFSNEQFITNPSFFEAENNTNQDIKNYSGKIDMEHPSEWANFSYGVKTTLTKTDSDVNFLNMTTGIPVFDPTQSNEFIYSENINAIYADMSKPLGEKWQTKIGLRFENTQTKGVSKTNDQTDTNSYNKLFPSVFVGYNPNSENMFNLSYSKRIQRPSFERLNPFRFYISPISYQEGNPFLQPQISDNLEVTHTYKGKLISKAFVSYVDDGSFNIIEAEDGDQQRIVITFDNFYTAYNYGLTETFIYNPTKWWNTMTQATLSKMDTRYKDGFDLDAKLLSGWNFQLYNRNTFHLNKAKTVQAETTLIYASPQKLMYFSVSEMVSLDLGLKFSLLDKKLNCTVAVNDILKRKATSVNTKTNGIDQTYLNYFDTQNVKISLNYSFGNKKIKVEQRNSGNEEEQNRAKNN